MFKSGYTNVPISSSYLHTQQHANLTKINTTRRASTESHKSSASKYIYTTPFSTRSSMPLNISLSK